MRKENLYDFTLSELQEKFGEICGKPYRAGQVFHWLYRKRVASFDEMTDLPRPLRKQIEGAFEIRRPECIEEQQGAGVAKSLLRLSDGLAVECVRIDSKDGSTACLSSQTGCVLSCAFCATGKARPVRNLTPGEIIGQHLHLSREIPVRNIVMMGMGEPFLNYDSVMKAISILGDSEGLDIGARRFTISTAGLVPEIYRFASEHSQVNLAVSLNGPNDKIRRKLMPIARYYPMDRLLRACQTYTEETHRRLTFEYVLIKDVNDRLPFADELARKLKGGLYHVNLIAHNPIPGSKQTDPDRGQIQTFLKRLTDSGIGATLRRSPGSGIDAACGQLAGRGNQGTRESGKERLD